MGRTNKARQHHGDNVTSDWNERLGRRVYRIQYLWTPKTEEQARACKGRVGKPKKVTETVPADPDGAHRLEAARTLKAKREREKRDPEFVPERYAKKLAAAREAIEAEQRISADEQRALEIAGLEWSAVAKEFLTEEAYDDADSGQSARGHLSRGGRYFGGSNWAEITPQDNINYTVQRKGNTGAFSGWPRSVGPQTWRNETATFRRVGNWLVRCGKIPSNPFAIASTDRNTRSRKKARRGLYSYEPKREAVIPSDPTVRLAFGLCERGWCDDRGTVEPDPLFTAFLALVAYTGSRPQSEPCRLRPEDVTLPSETVRDAGGEAALGSVLWTDTKMGRPVEVPLHPHAAELMRPIVAEAVAEGRLFVFEKRPGRPWDRFSYRDRWRALRARVAAEVYERAGNEARSLRGAIRRDALDAARVARAGLLDWWLRDFRKAFKTRLRQAGINNECVKVLQGHALTVDERYNEPTEKYKAKAILTLDWRPLDSAQESAPQEAQGAQGAI